MRQNGAPDGDECEYSRCAESEERLCALVFADEAGAATEPRALNDTGGAEPRVMALALADGGGTAEPRALPGSGGVEPRATALALADRGKLLLDAGTDATAPCPKLAGARSGMDSGSTRCASVG